ncbi:MAG: homoserine dehydrogenase [Deltaproteobacteria bacterium]|nr:homoserine dehydrogenase [Deltaproteobacteria bacterium]
MQEKAVKVGLLGLGTVGGGVARLLMEKRAQLSGYLGVDLELTRAVDLEPSRAADLGLEPGVYSDDAWSVLEDRDIDIVVETVGGLEPARAMVLTALNKGKGVVTANKALLASHGVEIFHAARQNQVGIAFEASVGGGIPLVRSLRDGLAANHITSCLGILNGTCNFILSRMTAEGAPFEQVLAQAQAKGYAEADPTFDVQGTDTAHKLAIVASLVTGAQPRLDDIPTEGITKITPLDIQFAGEFGFKIKLLAVLNNQGNKVEARVHPALVPHDHLLSSVEGPFNALHVNGDWVGQVLLYGQGAGRRPTASAVVGDVLELARDVAAGVAGRVPPLGTCANGGRRLELASLDEAMCQYYCRFAALDQPGVLAAVARELGEFGISIEKVAQKGRQEAGPVPIVMLTHEALEADLRGALKKIDALPVIVEPTVVIRMA